MIVLDCNYSVGDLDYFVGEDYPIPINHIRGVIRVGATKNNYHIRLNNFDRAEVMQFETTPSQYTAYNSSTKDAYFLWK